jgi:hydroxymethylbilane synthase
MWQAEHVATLLMRMGVSTSIVPLVSSGDTDQRPIQVGREVGVFTKRIQQAVLENEADIAVHSLKDLPTEENSRLFLAAVPKRETVVDSIVSLQGHSLESLPKGARVGTGSRRRVAQLLSLRNDLIMTSIRGNLQTRLAKLSSNEFDAIVLAEAGLLRLGLHSVKRMPLSMAQMLPAPGQGALGIEVRADDAESIETVGSLADLPSFAAVTAERTLLAALHGGCLAPIAAFASVMNGALTLSARVLSMDGQTCLEETAFAPFIEEHGLDIARQLGEQTSHAFVKRGAMQLINNVREHESK